MAEQADTCVAQVPMFSTLSYDQQLAVARFAVPVKVRAGELAFAPGTARSKLFVLHTGRLRLVRVLPDGREQLLRIVDPGDFAGEEAFLGGAGAEYAVVAAVDSQMCVFEHKDLPALISTYPAIAMRVLQIVSTRLLDVERRAATLAVSDMSTRVADYLLGLPLQATSDGQYAVTLPITKREVASYLGMTPETLSRTFGRLRKLGAIATEADRTIQILDLDRLVDLAAAA